MPIFRPLPVNVIGQRLDVAETAIGKESAVRVTPRLPGVVDDDGIEAVGRQAALNHPVGLFRHLRRQ
jgi:hypothetical protein